MSYTSSPSFTQGSTPVTPIRNAGKRAKVAAVSIGSIATVLTPASGKKFRLLGGDISVSANASVLFEDNVGGATIYQAPLLLTGQPFSFDLGPGYLSLAADNVLKATSSAAAAMTGTLYYSEE